MACESQAVFFLRAERIAHRNYLCSLAETQSATAYRPQIGDRRAWRKGLDSSAMGIFLGRHSLPSPARRASLRAMHLPYFMRRVNRVFTNPVLGTIAWLVPGMAVIHHVGRKTGREDG